jgi:hypothetical protein
MGEAEGRGSGWGEVDQNNQSFRLGDEQRLDWLRLIRSQNVGPRTFRALINHYGGARSALAALPSLARRGGADLAMKICSQAEAEREMEAANKLGVDFVALGEAAYPARLQMIDDAPPLIAVRGHAAVLTLPMVAVVGSRNASGAGPPTRGERSVPAAPPPRRRRHPRRESHTPLECPAAQRGPVRRRAEP